MTNSEKFLALYKEYEQLVRANGTDPKSVEDELSTDKPEIAGRLTMCRQFRNYLSHVPDPGFLEPSPLMMKFLQGRVDELKMQNDVVKKHLKKPDVCVITETGKVQEALEKMAKVKKPELLIQRADGTFGLLSIYDLVGFRGTAKLNAVKNKNVKPKFCGPLDPYILLDSSQIWLCTDNGQADGKLLGQVWFS